MTSLGFSFGGSASPFGPSAPSSGLSFGSGPAGTTVSGLSVSDVEKATGKIAGIASDARRIYDAVTGSSRSGPDSLVASGDPTYGKQATADTDNGSGAGAAVKRIFENVWATGKQVLDSAARGALEGSTAASAGARQGASLGAAGASINTTLLIGGVLALVLVLRK